MVLVSILYLFCIPSSHYCFFLSSCSISCFHSLHYLTACFLSRLLMLISPPFHCSPHSPLGNSSLPRSLSRLCLLILFLSLLLGWAGRVYRWWLSTLPVCIGQPEVSRYLIWSALFHPIFFCLLPLWLLTSFTLSLELQRGWRNGAEINTFEMSWVSRALLLTRLCL